MKRNMRRRYSAVVMGASAGGLHAISEILTGLSSDFRVPIFCVQHIPAFAPVRLPSVFSRVSPIPVCEPEDKEPIQPGRFYCAPPDYHLMIEDQSTVALSVDPPVLRSRPSIDVLFESAADVFGDRLVAVLLTGASRDGAKGIAKIHSRGGLTIAQNPETAEVSIMPKAAIATGAADFIMNLEEISEFLRHIGSPKIRHDQKAGRFHRRLTTKGEKEIHGKNQNSNR